MFMMQTNRQRHLPVLFTSQDCCSDEEVAHEAVLKYREWAAMKSMW